MKGVWMIEKELEKIVEAGNVSHREKVLQEYSSDISFVSPVKPLCVVRPGNAEEIEKIVKLANETRTPLVPVSSGPPHFRGDTVPSAAGAVIVDLSGMKRIIRVDRRNRVAMCEPGVTFGELIPAVAKEGLRLNMPLLPRKTKSVIGSMLEREPVIMPKYHWDIADPLACVEVIFGTGDRFRTGSAAGPGTIEEQWASKQSQNEAAGPAQASWYRLIQGAQGTMGIVTWASLRCEILPRLEEPFLAGSSELGKIMELVHWLIRLRLVNECFVLNNVNLASIMAKRWPDDYHNIKNALPAWVLFFNIAGYDYLPEERITHQVNKMGEIARNAGVSAEKIIGDVSAIETLKIVQNPSSEPFWKIRHQGGCHDLFFLCNYDGLHDMFSTMNKAAGKVGYPISDMGIYLQPIVQGVNCHCEFNLFYDPDNRKEVDRLRELLDIAVDGLISRGAFFSRPYGENAGKIINKDAATAAALRKVKNMFDPLNIMNPGKLCF
jgi:FAD/FMN-containing dehydrogenase